MKKLSRQEAIDIIYGCAVLGTGGGGNLQSGLNMIEECYDQGNVIEMAELSELGDDDFVATPYGCGAPRLLDGTTDDRYAKLPRLDYPAPLLAFRTLEEYMGKKFEIEGLNYYEDETVSKAEIENFSMSAENMIINLTKKSGSKEQIVLNNIIDNHISKYGNRTVRALTDKGVIDLCIIKPGDTYYEGIAVISGNL